MQSRRWLAGPWLISTVRLRGGVGGLRDIHTLKKLSPKTETRRRKQKKIYQIKAVSAREMWIGKHILDWDEKSMSSIARFTILFLLSMPSEIPWTWAEVKHTLKSKQSFARWRKIALVTIEKKSIKMLFFSVSLSRHRVYCIFWISFQCRLVRRLKVAFLNFNLSNPQIMLGFNQLTYNGATLHARRLKLTFHMMFDVVLSLPYLTIVFALSTKSWAHTWSPRQKPHNSLCRPFVVDRLTLKKITISYYNRRHRARL